MADPVLFKLRGAPLPEGRLPRAFQETQRSASSLEDDPFLPRRLLKIDQALDLSATARSTDAGRQPRAVGAAEGQVVVLELPDGVTVITHPDNLREALERVDPLSVDADGAIDFERALRTRGAGLRGSFGDALAGGLNAVVSRVYTLTVGQAADPLIEAARRKACEWLGVKAEEKIEQYAELGISGVGTRALMWAIESRLKREPGLYRWADGALNDRLDAGDPALQRDASAGPLLVLIHGTGSSTAGSFGDLQATSGAYWKGFEDRYGDRVLAFEHRTLSESPVENALQLARALPANSTLHVVTHSRGGLVGDLLCLENLDALAEGYALDPTEIGESDPAERERLRHELTRAHAEQRSALHELAAELRRKKLRVERYVRVACPARGTRLASGNFDVFLSALLSLMGWVPAFKGNPVYSAFKRVVLEIAKNRTKPQLVPGIEAMLPGSPLARLLARATPQPGMQLAIISGDVEGGGWLKRVGALFTDFMFFDSTDNDLVVDTDSMAAGVARPGAARVLFDQGPEVNHFRYFVNDGTRQALRRWLTETSVEAIEGFLPLRGLEATLPAPARTRTRAATAAAAAAMPVTVMLPGIMGSHLWLHRRERVWFSMPALALGGLARLRMTPGAKKDAVEAEALFAQSYGDLVRHLECTQRVVPFPYDWRQPLDVLADRLAAVLRQQLDATRSPLQPVRLLAHSMGGLVVRALVHRHAALWDELMSRDGARLVMLGTPHQGSHLMVEALIGKSDTVRKLGVLDLSHGLQEVLDIIAGFPGALQLLPKPGFTDTGHDASRNYFDPALWAGFKPQMRDLWFGDGVCALPDNGVLQQARWLWARDGQARPALPAKHESKVAYVFGCAARTPCGITREGTRWKMLGTPLGDGSVTWESGRIDGIGQFFYMPAEHGAMADTEAYFDSIAGLLEQGHGGLLVTSPPAVRGAEEAPPVASYDAGPVPYPTEVELAGGLFGVGRPPRARERRPDTLAVRVRAMDLRQVTQPILVGHYENDAISGAEAVIDRCVVRGELSVRQHLGLYAGPIGTASAVLLGSSPLERQRGSMRGVVVTGLGPYDGSLTTAKLTDAVRAAALRYLVHLLDSGALGAAGDKPEGVKLASLLLGYNSAANLTIADSVQALIRGVAEANRHFAQTTSSKLRIAGLDIVELYLDTAITATYEARQVAQTMNADARNGCRIEVDPLLRQGEGMRQRLYDGRSSSSTYWPRLMITGSSGRAARQGDAAGAGSPAAAAGAQAAPEAAPPRYAERINYLYLGQRARAESTVHQRQPGLVESMVQRQVMTLAYDPDFSRTLFQLLLPHDFKDTARQVQQMVFVLDGYTANLPWELMLADDRPLATRTAMVRQLSSTRYRTRINQTTVRRAYVVGNPSTAGYFKAFASGQAVGVTALDDLPAAEREAQAVAESLVRQGFEVERSIGADQSAIAVINHLYRRPYRIVHIAGHGVYEEPGADGQARSGVVLSDGLLVTAAEIDAMESVPDLVFLNCCHLGKVDAEPVAFNKLAYSVARQLIDIGVRAVVVAGWAVEDAPASLFAETFYEGLLAGNLNFGEAVFQARRTTWERFPASITWGAYQAYGDPSWRLDPRMDGAAPGSRRDTRIASPEELLDRIDCERQDLQRSGQLISASEARRLVARVQSAFAGVPDDWAARPDLLTALGEFYADLGPDYCALAHDCLQRAVNASDREGKATLRAIEQLATVECRLGVAAGDPAIVARGIDRLTQLVRLTGAALPGDKAMASDRAAAATNTERAGLLGSAWKRKAAVHAKAYLQAGADAEFAHMADALDHSSRAYEAMASKLGDEDLRPYPTLNWLFLWSLTATLEDRKAYVSHAQRCAAAANVAYAEEADAYNSIMFADAALVAALLDDSLAAAVSGSEAALEGLVSGYEDALDIAVVTPRERDSVVKQIRLMALFHHAYEKARGAKPGESVGDRLELLADRLSEASGDADEAADTGTEQPAAATATTEAAPAPKAPKAAKAAARKKAPAKRRRAPGKM